MQFSTILPLISLFAYLPCLQTAPVNSPAQAVTYAAITELLALFSISLDIKDFSALSQVFAADAVLGPGSPDAITGLTAIIDFYTKTCQNATLKTAQTSAAVYAYDITPKTASSISYAEAVYFGPAVFERGGSLFSNDSAVFREKFDTTYSKIKGEWRIQTQNLTILVGH